MGQILLSPVFVNKVLLETIKPFHLWQNRVVTKEPTYPATPKLFIIWSFTEKVC